MSRKGQFLIELLLVVMGFVIGFCVEEYMRIIQVKAFEKQIIDQHIMPIPNSYWYMGPPALRNL